MNKLALQKITIVIVLIAICIGFGYYLEIQPRKPENSSSLFSSYEVYMKRASGDIASLEVYVEPVTKYTDYNYYITVCNTSDQFVCGTLELVTAKDRVCYKKRFINLKPYEEKMIAVNLEYVPVDYEWKKVSFYDFTYPEINFNEKVSYDWDETYGYYWMNVITNEKLDAQSCLDYAKRVYVQDILAGSDSMDLFFYYGMEVEYIEKNSQMYPDRNSSYMGVSFDGERIQVVDLETSEIILEKLLK